MTHSPVPVQLGFIGVCIQPSKKEPESGAAVSVTCAPETKSNWQICPPVPQLMPAGELVTVPVPISPFIPCPCTRRV